MLSKLSPPLLLCVLIAVAWLITKSSPPAAQGSKPVKPAIQVNVSEVNEEVFVPRIHSSGTLQAKDEYAVYALVSGQVVYQSPRFKAGNYIQQGEVLLRLDASEYSAAVMTAKANLARAELSLEEELARAEQARNDWQKSGKDRGRAFVLREPHLVAARAALAEASSALELARTNLDRTEIKAQFDARLTSVTVQRGAYITPSTKLAHAYATDKAEVAFPVRAEDIPWLPDPDTAKVSITNPLDPSGAEWSAKLVRSGAELEASTRQLQLIAQINAPFVGTEQRRPLVMGQYIEGRIGGDPVVDAIVVNNAHIYQGPYVYVLEDGLLQRRDIVIVRKEPEHSLIKSGVKKGDLLVTTLLGRVSSGTPATVVPDGQNPVVTDRAVLPEKSD